MERVSDIRNQLWQTFTQLETARGKARLRCLRKARLLLLLADELLEAPNQEEPPRGVDGKMIDRAAGAGSILEILADHAGQSEKSASCQGLQSLLVVRGSFDRAKNPRLMADPQAQRSKA